MYSINKFSPKIIIAINQLKKEERHYYVSGQICVYPTMSPSTFPSSVDKKIQTEQDLLIQTMPNTQDYKHVNNNS